MHFFAIFLFPKHLYFCENCNLIFAILCVLDVSFLKLSYVFGKFNCSICLFVAWVKYIVWVALSCIGHVCVLVCSSSMFVNFHSAQQHCVTAVALGCCYFIKSNSHNSCKSHSWRNKQTNRRGAKKNVTIYKCSLWKYMMATGSNVLWKCMNAVWMRQLCPILQLYNIFHFSHDRAYLSPTSVDLHVQVPKFSSKPCSSLLSKNIITSAKAAKGTQISSPLSSALPRLHKAPKNHSPDWESISHCSEGLALPTRVQL